MATSVAAANTELPCRKMKLVQHHLSSLLKPLSFRATPEELNDGTGYDLADPDKRRQYFFGPYWTTYTGLSNEEQIKAFNDDVKRAFPRLMAVLIASTHPTDSHDPGIGSGWWWELPPVYQQEPDLNARATMMRDDVNAWINQAGLHMYHNVGTADKIDEGENEGDIDFLLIELVTFLYQFKDRPDLLYNDNVFTLLNKDWPAQSIGLLVPAGWTKTNIPVSGQDFEAALWFGDTFASDDYSFAETENHVLMTMTHFYLVNQWITNDYRGNLVGPYAPIPPMGWTAADWWSPSSASLVQMIRDMTGRVVHSGMFEDNAQPYQQLSYLAILALAEHAEDETVKTEAENALHFLATTFTFQSHEGRRWTPMRRNCEYAERLGMYIADGLAASMGVLSGAYKWNDSPYGLKAHLPSDYAGCITNPQCYWRNYTFKVDIDRDDSIAERIPATAAELEDDRTQDLTPQARALYTGFSSYRLPRALHGFMIDKGTGTYARMMPKYDRRHYEFSTSQIVTPEYFDGDTAFDNPTYNNEKTPAFYFLTNEFANLSGGIYNPYYGYAENSYIIPNNPTGPSCKGDKRTSGYDNLSKPYVVLPQVPATLDSQTGAVRYYRPFGLDADFDFSAASEILPMMRGDSDDWFKSANIATYKNFSYGYRVRDTGFLKWAKLGGEFPQDIPKSWEAAPKAEFSIGSARFIIYDLRKLMEENGQAGHYLITARVRKYLVEFWSTRVARGFWEVVPGNMFADVQAVAAQVQSFNGAGNFELTYGAFDKDFDYKMVTTGETLRLDQRYGAIFKNLVTLNEGEVQGLIGAETSGGSGIDLEDVFTEIMKESHTNALPLIDVKAVRPDFSWSMNGSGGHVYYACAKDGWICVNNRDDGSYLWVDSRRGPGLTPYWEHGTFDGSPSAWGCGCGTGGGGWTPDPPDNGIPDGCSDPAGCDNRDPSDPHDPRDPETPEETCERPSSVACDPQRPACGPGEECVADAAGNYACRCPTCVSSGESCAERKPCANPEETCYGLEGPDDVGQCGCVR